MPAKTSKQSSDREKAARFVLSALFQRGLEISHLLAELFLPHRQEGDPEPDFHRTIIALGRKLKHAIDKVVAADNRLFAANAALDTERDVRGNKASQLSRLVIGLRGACNSLFVDLPVQQLGFDARTAQDPVPLLMQADRVADNLESGPIEAETLFEGDDFNPQKYAAQVREGALELRTCLDQVSDLQRGAEAALLDKRTVTEEYDDLFLHGARAFESYWRMVGETELADRVRPSEIRRGRTEVPPDETPDSTGDQVADDKTAAETAAAEGSTPADSADESARRRTETPADPRKEGTEHDTDS